MPAPHALVTAAGETPATRSRRFLDEVCSFPNAQFDDQVDAFADALNELALGSTFTLDNI